MKLITSLPLFLVLLACAEAPATPKGGPASAPASAPATVDPYAPLPKVGPGQASATFAGGCFWCMEKDFEKLDGIVSVTSGYVGGHKDRPTYREVSSRTTGHAEAVLVVYETKKLSYQQLLDHFWVNVDPTTDDRQFCDSGDEYRPEIFTHDAAQHAAALASKKAITGTFEGPNKVKVTKLFEKKDVSTTFFTAENYHQDFYKKSPGRYNSYRTGCRRDARLKQLWGKR